MQIQNAHKESWPEWVDTTEGRQFLAYYQNQYGEQWFAAVVHGRFVLAGGDCGWKSYSFEAHQLDTVLVEGTKDEVLQAEEVAWIQGILPTVERILKRELQRTGT